MKLCLIGNSHASMLIASHKKSAPVVDLTIFAKPSLKPEEVGVENGVLRALSPEFRNRLETMGVSPELDLSRFDKIVVTGLVPAAFAAIRLAQTHMVTSWPATQKLVRRVVATPDAQIKRPFLTQAAYRQALLSLTRASLGYELIADLRRTSAIEVAMVPQPFPSAALLEMEGAYPILRRRVLGGNGPALAADLTMAHREALGDLSNLTYLPQPSETVHQGCLSDASYMRGAVRLDVSVKQPATDVLHANARLGALYWKQLLCS